MAECCPRVVSKLCCCCCSQAKWKWARQRNTIGDLQNLGLSGIRAIAEVSWNCYAFLNTVPKQREKSTAWLVWIYGLSCLSHSQLVSRCSSLRHGCLSIAHIIFVQNLVLEIHMFILFPCAHMVHANVVLQLFQKACPVTSQAPNLYDLTWINLLVSGVGLEISWRKTLLTWQP